MNGDTSRVAYSKIVVTEWIKVPFLVYKFFLVYLSTLEGVPTKPNYVGAENKMAIK